MCPKLADSFLENKGNTLFCVFEKVKNQVFFLLQRMLVEIKAHHFFDNNLLSSIAILLHSA